MDYNKHVSETFLSYLNNKCRRLLEERGLVTAEQIRQAGPKYFKDLPGFGTKSLRMIANALVKTGAIADAASWLKESNLIKIGKSSVANTQGQAAAIPREMWLLTYNDNAVNLKNTVAIAISGGAGTPNYGLYAYCNPSAIISADSTAAICPIVTMKELNESFKFEDESSQGVEEAFRRILTSLLSWFNDELTGTESFTWVSVSDVIMSLTLDTDAPFRILARENRKEM